MTRQFRAKKRPARRGRKLSQVLSELAADTSRERVSVAEIVAAMGDRAIAATMLVFALPNVLPMPPGISGLLGAPLVILATQLMLGKSLWLPGAVATRSMGRDEFAALLDRAGPWLRRAERLVRRRLDILVRPPAEYAIGGICLLLAIILMLPIPLGNVLPALAICLYAFAVLERDGLWVLFGIATTVISVIVVAAVVWAFAKAAMLLLAATFG